MGSACVLVAFVALVVLALWFVKAGVKPSLAPLCAAGSTVLWFVLWGCLGLLKVGGWLFYALVLCGAVGYVLFAVTRWKRLPQLAFGFWFFVLGGLVFIALLWAKQPMFTGWDEFSHWGTAAKLMTLYDEMYTTAPVGWIWPVTQKPALTVFSYFFQLFGGSFAEWQTYAAYDVLYMALLAAVLAPFDGKWRKNWDAALPMALICVLVPYVFQHYETVNKVSPVYLDTLADIPLGLAFAACLAAGFAEEGGRRWQDILPPAIGLALLTLTKDIGFSIALVAAVLLAVNWFFAVEDAQVPLAQRVRGALLHLGIWMGTVLLCFGGWEIYTAVATGANRVDSTGTTESIGMLQMPVVFLRDLFAVEKDSFFTHITGSMVRFFFTTRGTMLGSGFMIALLVFGVLALAALLHRDRQTHKRLFGYAVFSTLGFAAYYLLITMCYLYLFRKEQAMGFESIERYVYPYYIGWLLGALVLLAQVAIQTAAGRETNLKTQRWAAVGKGVVWVLAVGMLLRVIQLVPVPYTVLGVHSDEYNERREFSASVVDVRQRLVPDGKTFLVMSGDTGIGWFKYCFEMLPWQMDYSYGGTMETREKRPDGTVEKQTVEPEEWRQHLLDTGCTTVFIDYADPVFIETYGEVFADGMNEYTQGRCNLYEVRPENGTTVLYPVTTA